MPKINIRNLKNNIKEYKNRSKLTRKDDLIEFVELTKMNLNDINNLLLPEVRITANNKKKILIDEFIEYKNFNYIEREAEITRQEQEFDDEDIEEPIFQEADEVVDFDDFDDGEVRQFGYETQDIYNDRLKGIKHYKVGKVNIDEEYIPTFTTNLRVADNDNVNCFDITKDNTYYGARLPNQIAKSMFSDKNINSPLIVRLLFFDLETGRKYIYRDFSYRRFNYIKNRKLFDNIYKYSYYGGLDSAVDSLFSNMRREANFFNIVPQIQFLFPERLTKENKINGGVQQYFKHGIKNCFLTPMLNYYQSLKKTKLNKTKINYINKLLKLFKNGVPENNIQEICDKLVCSVRIYDVYRHINKTYEGKNSNKIFKLINTCFDHVDVFKDDDEFEVEELTQIEINNIYNNLLKDKKYFLFKKNVSEVNQIITESKKYTLKSHYNDYCKEFKKNINIFKHCAIDYINDKKLSNYLSSGVHSNNCVDFTYINNYRNKNVKEIDQIKSHTQFKKSKYYKGFLGKPTDIFRIIDIDESEYINFLNKVIGIFTIDILNCDNVKYINYIKKLNIYNVGSKITIPSPEISFLIDLGFKIKILYGCFSPINCNFDFDFDEVMTNTKEGKVGYYSKFCGQLFCKSEVDYTYCNYDEKLIDVFNERYPNQFSIGDNKNILCLKVKKERGVWYPQVYAFILSYARLNVMTQLFNISFDNILRIVGDGIYIYDDNAKYEILDSFRVKSESLKFNVATDSFIYAEKNFENIDFSEFKKLPKFYDQQHIYYVGCGGGGKTYNALSDSFNDVLYVAPSHKLLRAKKEEFPNIKSTTLTKLIGIKKLNKDEINDKMLEDMDNHFNKLLFKPTGEKLEEAKKKFIENFIKNFKNIGCLAYHEKYIPSVIICDEITQYTNGQKNKIMELYPKSKIIFCGDIDENDVHYQLPNFTGDKFLLGLNVVEFNESKRCKDKALLNKLNFVRERIKENSDKKAVLKYVIDKKFFNIISKDNVHKLYTIDDYILCSKHIYIDEWTDLFKGKFDKEKYYITKKSNNYCNGDIVISDNKPPSSEIKHAFTCHAIQGETIKTKIFIDTRNLFENQMLYTALSRAQYGNQIYLIV